ncbi:MAG: preprotein translocase subunit SecE [Ruminococcaceae bacterium]|nr:preprotein translocase subunit SecE [Oscillospiraceae bacterium]
MADEIKKTSAEASEKKETKKSDSKNTAKPKNGNVFARAWKAVKKFFKDIRGECKKVVWPDAKTVIKSTGIVLACVAVLGLIIWLIDMGLSEGVKALVNLAKNSGADAETTTAAVTGMIHGFLGL